MKNLAGMAIFAHVVEARSFSAAARRLGLSKSMVSKEVTKLEHNLGARFRIARALPDNLVARRLAPINRVVCAAPAYFERHGTPRRPQDLSRHNCLVYTHANRDSPWRFRSEKGEAVVA